MRRHKDALGRPRKTAAEIIDPYSSGPSALISINTILDLGVIHRHFPFATLAVPPTSPYTSNTIPI
jgi:hypothetical protein